MGTPFQDACVALSAAVDDIYGEAEGWLYSPMASPRDDVNARPAPDPDRPQRTITGAWIEGFARALSGPTRMQGVDAIRAAHAAARPICDFDLAMLPYRPRAGDRVTRIQTGKVYRVAEVRPDAANVRAQLDLNEI